MAVFLAALMPCVGGNAPTKFTPLDVTPKGNALFTASSGMCGVLFAVDVSSPSNLLEPLSCYPESIEVLPDGKVSVSSMYAAAVYDTNTATLSIPAAKDITIRPVRMRKEEDNSKKWSPDGSYYVYAKGGNVYFCDPKAESQGVQIGEEYRYICRGTINSVCWVSVNRSLLSSSSAPKSGSSSSRIRLYFIEGDTIKVIEQNSLYTQSVYSKVLGHGKILGRLPYTFDGVRDKFSVRSDGKAISVLKSNALFSVYKMEEEVAPILTSGAIISLDTSVPVLEGVLMWGGEDAVLWTTVLSWDGKENTVVQSASPNGGTKMLMTDTVRSPAVSPNGQKVAFFSNGMIRVFAADAWKELGQYDAEHIISAAWDGNYAMYLGGQSTVSRWIVGDKNAESLFPSAVTDARWSANGVVASCPNGVFFTLARSPQGLHWQVVPQMALPSKQNGTLAQGARYRLFCTASPNSAFENALYVRKISMDAKGQAYPSTRPVSLSSAQAAPPKRRIALILDAYANAEYLMSAILSLKSSGVKAAAFLNGAFISRYPNEVRAIANSGIPSASLFFADTDFTGFSTRIEGIIPADSTFIARGLAKNEDEFLRVTGQELLPMWHAPHYKADDAVKKAGEKAGYKYIDAIDTSIQDEGSTESAQDALSRLLAALNASDANVAAIPVGSVLCQKMDYLIAALQDARYQIVGIEEL